jgi:hypothetical protein
MNINKSLVVGAVVLLVLGFAASRVSAQNKTAAEPGQATAQNAADRWRTQTFVIGMGEVEGAQLRRLKVSGATTCYFWKDSNSCVKD